METEKAPKRLTWFDIVLNPPAAPTNALPVNIASPESPQRPNKDRSTPAIDLCAARSSRMPPIERLQKPTCPAKIAAIFPACMGSATQPPPPGWDLEAWVPRIKAELAMSNADIVAQKWLPLTLEFHEYCVEEYRKTTMTAKGEGTLPLDEAKKRLEAVQVNVSKILTAIEEAREGKLGRHSPAA